MFRLPFPCPPKIFLNECSNNSCNVRRAPIARAALLDVRVPDLELCALSCSTLLVRNDLDFQLHRISRQLLRKREAERPRPGRLGLESRIRKHTERPDLLLRPVRLLHLHDTADTAPLRGLVAGDVNHDAGRRLVRLKTFLRLGRRRRHDRGFADGRNQWVTLRGKCCDHGKDRERASHTDDQNTTNVHGLGPSALRRPQRLMWDHAETIATSTLTGLALPSALPPARTATGWICTRNLPGGVAEGP